MSWIPTKGKATVAPEMKAPERLSKKAVAFGQHIIELEDSLDTARQQIDQLERNLKLALTENEMLTRKLENAEKEKDKYQRKWYTTRAQLKSSASIILDAMREDDEDVIEKFKPGPMGLRAVERELGTRKAMEDEGSQMPLPGFLGQGPREP